MTQRQIKTGVFLLTAFNSIGTTYYFNYIYFFARKEFGFDRLQNMVLAAALGFAYMVASILGGRFAQRRGYFRSLRVGFFTMAVTLLAGARIASLPGQIAIMFIATIGMCFTWPALEALISEEEPVARLQRMVGIYNLTWAGAGALAYFTGGALLDRFGLRSMFYVPAVIHGLQFLGAWWLEQKSKRPISAKKSAGADDFPVGLLERPISKVSPKTFLTMAWLANPFAYLAVNTIFAVMPSLAAGLHLSNSEAGFYGSLWMFVRTASFLFLWKWTGWHYRFRWLATAYVAMVVGFTVVLFAPGIPVWLMAQICFGAALGLIYYSSLFYSMDAGERKGEHGGIHEAAIGAGNCAGPAMGAAALYFFPQHVQSGTWAVSGCLVVGLAGLIWLRWRKEHG